MPKCSVSEKGVKDLRVRRTQALLHEALGTLIREKPYDAIAVTEILRRAKVARSTFYSHFSDKDELLTLGIHEMLRPAASRTKWPQAIVWFSLPVFEHLYEHRRTTVGRMGARSRAMIHEHLANVLTRLIAETVNKEYRMRGKAARAMAPDLLAKYVASTFILVLNWWVESDSSLPPNEVNALFHSLVLPSIENAFHD